MKQPTKASPKAQQLYNWVMEQARKVIYGTSPEDRQRFDLIVKKLKTAGGEIGDVIGQSAALILFNVKGAAQKSNIAVPDAVLFAAGRELVTDLIHIAQAANAMPDGKQTAIEQQAIAAGLKAFQDAANPPSGAQPSAPAAQPPAQPAPPQQPQQPAGLVQGAMAGA